MIEFKSYRKPRPILAKFLLLLCAIVFTASALFLVLALPFFLLHEIGDWLHKKSKRYEQGGAK